MTIVQKFGGSSLDGEERLRRSAEITAQALETGDKAVVVVSAMGGSTDELSELAHSISPCPDSRELDALLSSGEQQSAALMAIMLQSMGIAALSLNGWQSGIYTNSMHGDAHIEQTLPWRVAQALRQGITPVVTGFQGVDIKGDVTTLGRGGSDTTAVALAAALSAERCCIYSDVAGVYSADPRLVKSALPMALMDSRDMLTLAHSGSQLLHAKSVALAMEQGIELELRSAFGEQRFSRVLPLDMARRPPYAGVTRDKESSRLSLVGRACSAATLRDVSALLRENGVEVYGGRSGESFIWVKTAPGQLCFALELVHEAYFTGERNEETPG